MSEGNVEVVREAWNAYGERGIDGYVEYCAEDWVGDDVPELPDGASYRGTEGARERERHFREMWADWSWEPVEFRDAGGDIVVAVFVMRARGRGSDVPVEIEGGFVYEVRDGKIARDCAFTSKDQALEAAGLSE
jgi:ketosteroid isomerase-like protein